MKSGSYNIVRVKGSPVNKFEVVERDVSGSLVSILEAARAHGGDALKPIEFVSSEWCVVDNAGAHFFAVENS